jgi:hypothetical protein
MAIGGSMLSRRSVLPMVAAAIVATNALITHATSAQATRGSGPGSLLGSWDAVSRSPGGLGSTLFFGADNTLSLTVGAMFDLRYKRSGDSLFVIDAEGDSTISRIKFVGDTLVATGEKGEQRKIRLGAAARGDSLIGLWTYPHYTGVMAFEEYTPAGQLRLRVPIRTLTGTYVASGEKAVMHLLGEGGGDREVKFAVSGDTLQLTWDAQTSRYLRATTLPVTRVAP